MTSDILFYLANVRYTYYKYKANPRASFGALRTLYLLYALNWPVTIDSLKIMGANNWRYIQKTLDELRRLGFVDMEELTIKVRTIKKFRITYSGKKHLQDLYNLHKTEKKITDKMIANFKKGKPYRRNEIIAEMKKIKKT